MELSVLCPCACAGRHTRHGMQLGLLICQRPFRLGDVRSDHPVDGSPCAVTVLGCSVGYTAVSAVMLDGSCAVAVVLAKQSTQSGSQGACASGQWGGIYCCLWASTEQLVQVQAVDAFVQLQVYFSVRGRCASSSTQHKHSRES